MTTSKNTAKLTAAGLFVIFITAVILILGLRQTKVLAANIEKPNPKRILAIFLFKQGLPWAYRIEESMRLALASNSAFPTELNVEHADLSRYPQDTYIPKVMELFRYKYSRRKMDVVIAVGDESTNLLMKHGAGLFGDVPAVFITIDRQDLPKEIIKPHMRSLLWGWDFKKTINIIENSLPQSKHLFIVSGISMSDQKLRNLARKALSGYGGKLAVEYLSGLAIEDLLEKVARLPKHSVIFYLTIFRDGNGKSFVPREIMSVISEKANAPVFGIVDTYLGHGTVGGYLLSAEHQGKRYARIAESVLRGEPIKDADFMEKGNLPMFDWQQLKRWSIDEDTLPPESIVRYKNLTIWDLYKWYIIGGIILIFVQGFFVITLTVQRQKGKQREQRLRISDDRYKAFIKNSTEQIWCTEFDEPIDINLPEDEQFDLAYKHTYMAEANDAYARSVGFEHGEDLIGARLEEFCPRSDPKNVATVKAWIRGRFHITNAETIESYKDGVTRNFLNNSRSIIEAGHVVRVWGTATDITDQRALEKKLKKAEQKYRTVADFTYDWEYWAKVDGTMEYVSPSCERISGYTVGDFLENPSLFTEIILPQDLEIWDRHYLDSRQKLKPQEIQFRIKRPDGQIRWIEHFCQPVINNEGRLLGFRASNRDVTSRKLTEEILEQSRKFNRAVLMSMIDHIAVLDKAGNILTVNNSWLDFARENDVSSPELVGEGTNYLDACRRASDDSDESAQKVLGGIKSVLNGEQEQFEIEYPCHSPTEQRWYLMRVIPFKGEKGGIVVAHSNITKRKYAENELKAKETMLEEAQRIARLGSWSWDIMTDELSWSVEVYRIFGISPQEFGATYEYFLDWIHPDDLEGVKEAVQSALADPSVNYNIMHRIITPDGEERIVRARGNVTYDNHGKASRMIGTLQDVTDIRQMEMETDKLKAELSHLDRVSSMGVLTAGIAHEINQPLAAILSNAQAAIRFLKKKPQDLKEVKNALQDIISDGKRSGEMVHSIRNIMKRYEPKHQEIDLNETVRKVLILLKSEALNKKVFISQKLQSDIPPVYGDRVEIQQVTLNLVMNALEALSEPQITSPEITVSTRFEDNKYVILSVSDSGPGIEQNRIDSIFEAFETTKKAGLGIGLSICRSLADNHGGQIWAENRPEGGAIFFFSLPLRTTNDE